MTLRVLELEWAFGVFLSWAEMPGFYVPVSIKLLGMGCPGKISDLGERGRLSMTKSQEEEPLKARSWCNKFILEGGSGLGIVMSAIPTKHSYQQSTWTKPLRGHTYNLEVTCRDILLPEYRKRKREGIEPRSIFKSP